MMINTLEPFPVPPADLEDRLDVAFYYPSYRKIIKQISEHSKLIALGEIAIITRILGFETEKYVKYVEKGIPYLRVQNIREFEVVLNGVKFITKRAHQRLKRSQLKPNDVVLTITGRVGTAAVVPGSLGECNTSQEIIRIRPKIEINPYYLAAFLNSNFGKSLIERWQSGSTRPRTLIRNVRNIPIPILSANTQTKIEKVIKNSLTKKRKIGKNIESTKDIANDVLTNYLKIKLPSIEDRPVFTIASTYIKDRLDAGFYFPRYTSLLKTIQRSSHEVKPLEEISKTIASGQRPKGGVKYIESGIPSIGGEHITSEGDFNFENIKYIPKEFHLKQKKSWVKPFDILVVKDGATTGKVAIALKDFPFEECNINEHVFKIEVKKGYNPYYLFSYLFSSLGQEQIIRLISGAAQKGIARNAIEKVETITPPLRLQDKIADKIKKRKEESKKLKKEADRITEITQKKVVDLILGKRQRKV